MRLLASPHKSISSRQVSIAAENMAAAQFALYGFDVLEQAGHSKFFYDLSVARSGGMLKVSVHGSVEGFWDVVDIYLDKNLRRSTRSQYHRAIDLWLERHSGSVVCCLVQFDSTDLTGMPRMYLASAPEIAQRLHENTEQIGDFALYEQYETTDASGVHSVEALPENWRFSRARIAELMEEEDAAALETFSVRFSGATACKACAAQRPASCLDCLPMMN